MGAESDEEFREFMHGRWPAMVRLAYGLTGDPGQAEDIAQAAFARAYASWGRVSKASDPDAYVRRIVINENRKLFRRRRVAEELSGTLPEIGVWDETSSESSLLLDALRRTVDLGLSTRTCTPMIAFWPRREALLIRVEVRDLHVRLPQQAGEAEGSRGRVVPGRVAGGLTMPG